MTSVPFPPGLRLPGPWRARMVAAAQEAEAEAGARDADGQFPAASFRALRLQGLLSAPLPPALGGGGLGGLELLTALRLLGRASLPVGRL